MTANGFRRRLSGFVLPALVAAVALVALASAWWWWTRPVAGADDDKLVLHDVARQDFLFSVTERGEIESAGVTDVVSEVKAKNTTGIAILRIVPEGTVVKKGDFLVELDSSALKEERVTQQILVNTARAVAIQSQNVYETAEIAREEYIDGTYVQERQTIEGEVFVAEENLNRAKEYYEFSKRLSSKGYVNQLQLEADKFAVDKSMKELDAAKTKLKVIDDYTRAKMLKQLESDIATSKAKWDSDMKSLELEESKLADIDDQIAKCTMVAPKDGTVVYAHERQGFGGDDFVVKEGAVIRERQAIIRLPDPTAMRVAMTINESLIQHIRPGMPATISPVGMGDKKLHGTVQTVNQYAEPGGWRKANVKEYKARVSIDEPADILRSGMTASVTIKCDEVPDALVAPLQAIYAHGPQMYAFVYKGSGAWEPRPVTLGPANDKFLVVKEGLAVGDRITMSPKRFVDKVQLPDLPKARAGPGGATRPRTGRPSVAGGAPDGPRPGGPQPGSPPKAGAALGEAPTAGKGEPTAAPTKTAPAAG